MTHAPALHAAILADLPTTHITRALLDQLPQHDALQVLARACAGGLAPRCPHPLSGWSGWECEPTGQLELALWHHSLTLPVFAPLRVDIEAALIWGSL